LEHRPATHKCNRLALAWFGVHPDHYLEVRL